MQFTLNALLLCFKKVWNIKLSMWNFDILYEGSLRFGVIIFFKK